MSYPFAYTCTFAISSLWPMLFCTEQNNFDRAEQESNGARHLWEWVLAPLGAIANPTPVSCSQAGGQSCGLCLKGKIWMLTLGKKFCMRQGGRCQYRTEWGG